MTVLVDTNVLLDVLGMRQPHYAASAAVWSLAETRQISAFIAAMSIPTAYYILRREKGRAFALSSIADICTIFEVASLDKQLIVDAMARALSDFEDAVQLLSAERTGAMTLITRNVKDFPAGPMQILAPSDFLAAHFSS
jgi:predicted nucleic acid-binding protein